MHNYLKPRLIIIYVTFQLILVINIFHWMAMLLKKNENTFIFLLTDECISDIDSKILVTLKWNQIFKNDVETVTTFFFFWVLKVFQFKWLFIKTLSTFLMSQVFLGSSSHFFAFCNNFLSLCSVATRDFVESFLTCLSICVVAWVVRIFDSILCCVATRDFVVSFTHVYRFASSHGF